MCKYEFKRYYYVLLFGIIPKTISNKNLVNLLSIFSSNNIMLLKW